MIHGEYALEMISLFATIQIPQMRAMPTLDIVMSFLQERLWSLLPISIL
jgi:hypothetical protein